MLVVISDQKVNFKGAGSNILQTLYSRHILIKSSLRLRMRDVNFIVLLLCNLFLRGECLTNI